MNRPATPPQSASTIWYQARVSATKTRSAADHSAASSARRTSDAASSTKSIVPYGGAAPTCPRRGSSVRVAHLSGVCARLGFEPCAAYGRREREDRDQGGVRREQRGQQAERREAQLSTPHEEPEEGELQALGDRRPQVPPGATRSSCRRTGPTPPPCHRPPPPRPCARMPPPPRDYRSASAAPGARAPRPSSRRVARRPPPRRAGRARTTAAAARRWRRCAVHGGAQVRAKVEVRTGVREEGFDEGGGLGCRLGLGS
eukprot:scaffold9657_cov63-Phaeocystis_antarctica.AAC.3